MATVLTMIMIPLRKTCIFSCLWFTLDDEGNFLAGCNKNDEGSILEPTADLNDFIGNDETSSTSLKWDSTGTGFSDSCDGSLTLEFKTDGVWLVASSCSYDSGDGDSSPRNKSINLSSGLKYRKDSYDFHSKQ